MKTRKTERMHPICSRLAQKALAARIPLSGTLELLPYCNLRCQMCYVRQDMPSDWADHLQPVRFWMEMVDQAIEAQCLFVLLTGGEPFLYPAFPELLETIRKKPIVLTINTNGTLLSEETVSLLEYSCPKMINISLYGAGRDTYQSLCGNGEAFDCVCHGMDLLRSHRIPFRLHVPLTPRNMKDFDEIKRIRDYYHVPIEVTPYMIPASRRDLQKDEEGNGRTRTEKSGNRQPQKEAENRQLQKESGNPDRVRFSPEEAAAAEFMAVHTYYKERSAAQLALVRERSGYTEETKCMTRAENSGIPDCHIMCRGGLSGFWIDWKGRMSSCGLYTPERIDLHQHSFAEAWKEVVFRTENRRISEKCAGCDIRSLCRSCAGAAFCETGNPAGTPDYLCRYAGSYLRLLQERR